MINESGSTSTSTLTPLTLSHTLESHTCTACCHCGCDDAVPDSTTRNTISMVFFLRAMVNGEAKYIGKTLAAAVMFATVRFFTRVSPDVHRQRTTLDEAFHTTSVTTVVRSFVGMDSIMSLEIRLPVKTLAQLGYQHVPWTQ